MSEILHIIQLSVTDSNGKDWRLVGSGDTFNKAAESVDYNLDDLKSSVGKVKVVGGETKVTSYPLTFLNPTSSEALD